MATGIRQKVTKDAWDSEPERVIASLADTLRVQFELTQGRNWLSWGL